jgi:hypothetical protein
MTQPRRDRRWTEDLRVYDEAGNYLGVDRERGMRALIEVETILAREGGAITVMPIRVEQPPLPGALTQDAEMTNIGYVFDHVFAPTAGRAPAPQQNGGPVFPAAAEQAQGNPEGEHVFVARPMVEGDEPSAVMPQPPDSADQHTEPRASNLPEPAPLSPGDLTPQVQ